MTTSDKRELTFLAKLEDLVSRPLKKIGDQADDTKDDLEEVNQGLKKLDDRAAETTKTLDGLRKEIAKSGDLDLIKDIQKQEARLKALARQRKSLVGDGEEEAKNFVARFTAKIGPLLASAPVSPPMAAAFAGAAAAVSPIVAGAVTAGVATAGVGAGLAIAFKDPRVQEAGKGLGAELGASLKDAAKPFVPETLKSIGIVRAEFRELKPVIDDIFSDSAKHVVPLTRAATGFTREVAMGFRDANRNAGPLVETLGEHLPKLGKAAGDVLRSLSEESSYTAQQIDGFLTSVEGIVTFTGKLIEVGNKIGPYVGGALLPLIGTLGDTDEKAEEAADSTEDLGNKVKTAGDKAGDAAPKVETFAEMVDRLVGENIDAERASIRLEDAIDRAAEAVTKNGKTLDINSEKGRNNKAALLDIAEASRRAYDAILTQTGSQNDANAAMERGRKKFIELAEKMGMSRTEALKLADALFALPSPNVSVTVRNKEALAAIKAVQQSLGKIKDVHVGVYYTAQGNLKLPGGTQMKAGGGPIEGPGPKGVDSELVLAAPGEHMWTAEEVDAAGGHAAVERMRRAVLSGAKATAVSGGGMSGGGQAAERRIIILLEGTGVLAGLRREIRVLGGDVQVVLGTG